MNTVLSTIYNNSHQDDDDDNVEDNVLFIIPLIITTIIKTRVRIYCRLIVSTYNNVALSFSKSEKSNFIFGKYELIKFLVILQNFTKKLFVQLVRFCKVSNFVLFFLFDINLTRMCQINITLAVLPMFFVSVFF